jgi:hypothetical protein
MKNKRCFGYVITVLVALLLITACNNPVSPGNSTASAITLISPNGGETFKIGDSLHIKWRVNPDSIGQMLFSITFDAGRSYTYINDMETIHSGNGRDTLISWKIPDSLYRLGIAEGTPTPVSSQCKVRVSDYGGGHAVLSGSWFSVIR